MARRLGRIAAVACASAAVMLAGGGIHGSRAIAQDKPGAGEAEKGLDRVTFKNGRVVEGRIVEQNDRELKMEVVFAGISAVTTYARSEILTIERGVVRDAGGEPAATTATPSEPAPASERTTESASSGGGARVYMVELKGVFGKDVTETPLQRALDDAQSMDPDVVVFKLDLKPAEEIDFPGFAVAERIRGFDGLFLAENMTPVFERAIREGRRIVFWVKRAEAGAAFLPLIGPEIYFSPDGRLGGIGTLQRFDMGDKRVNEKQISLRLGHAEGIAIQGGYAPELVRAMARSENWLAVRFEGGEPKYMMREPTKQEQDDGWIVLSDDGEGNNKDTMEMEVRRQGNDVLNLDAKWARDLRVSKGTAGTLEDLVFEMNLGSSHTVIEGKGQGILDDWSKRVNAAEEEIRRLFLRHRDLQPQQGEDQARYLGKKMQLLREISGILGVYAEVFDREGGQRAQLASQIEAYREEIRKLSQRDRRG
ncbi:MAG: hypothetical protein AB7G17_11675 [Phycisphaerales bacterium]